MYLNRGPMAATWRLRLLLAPPTLRDSERCSKLPKISTWSALEYLAISNLWTRNWRRKKKADIKAISWREEDWWEQVAEAGCLQSDLDPYLVRSNIWRAGDWLTLLWCSQRISLHLSVWEQTHLQLHGHLPGARHLSHKLDSQRGDWYTNALTALRTQEENYKKNIPVLRLQHELPAATPSKRWLFPCREL